MTKNFNLFMVNYFFLCLNHAVTAIKRFPELLIASFKKIW